MNFDLGFLASIVVVLLASRLLGEAAQRLGQPVVIGQLVAGIMLGPSFFGLLWPDAEHALFSADPVQKTTLQGFGEFGILLLLVLTGMEVDVRRLRKIGPPALSVSLAGIAVPFAFGSALGFAAPPSLIPNTGQRLPMALFLGVALSISSIKVVATVVRDMNFARRDLGQIIVASSIIEDSLCWILIAVILGIVRAGGVGIGRLAGTIAGVALFLAASLTAGRRLVADAIRLVNDAFAGEFMVLTLILIIMGVMALLTQALGVQSVLGAFVAGVLIGESPILTKRISEQLRGMVASFFAPIFFTLAGLNSDLTRPRPHRLRRPPSRSAMTALHRLHIPGWPLQGGADDRRSADAHRKRQAAVDMDRRREGRALGRKAQRAAACRQSEGRDPSGADREGVGDHRRPGRRQDDDRQFNP